MSEQKLPLILCTLCSKTLEFKQFLKQLHHFHVIRVSVERCGEPSAKWFCELSKFLSQLRGSKIRLCLNVHCNDSFDYQAGDIKGLNVCEMEELTMDTSGLPSLCFYALLDGLFQVCRPRMIIQYVSLLKDDEDEDEEKNFHNDTELNTINKYICLCEALEQGVKVRSFLGSQFMYGLRDLDEVNHVHELFDEVRMPQPFDSVLNSKQLFDEVWMQ